MLKTWEEVDAFVKKYPHTWKGRVCDICGNDRNNEVCLCHAHYKEVSALKKKYEALAASHRRLVDVMQRLTVGAGSIKTFDALIEFHVEAQAALAEAEELIKKEE